MGLNLKILKWALSYLHEAIYTESVADQTFHFADTFVHKTLRTIMIWRRYDVRKFTADSILFREIQC